MNIADRLIDQATTTVEAGGLWWRVRRISSLELLQAGLPALLIAPGGPTTETPAEPPPESEGAEQEGADEAAQLRAHIQRLRENPGLMAQTEELAAHVVAAGVTAARADGQTWQPLKVVLDHAQQSARLNKVHISSLPVGTVKVLYKRIMALSKGGVDGTTLATFPGGAPPSGRPPRPPR